MDTQVRKQLKSELEIEFAQLWEENYPHLDLHIQYPFAKPMGRRHRADFCCPRSLVIIELQGGTYNPEMGHSLGSGIQRDYEKFCLAASLGYVLFPLTKQMLEDQYLTWIRLIASTIEARLREAKN